MPVADPGSLSDRVAARRKQREQKRSAILTIPVDGYEDLFAASYRRVTPTEKEQILDRFDLDANGIPKDRIGSSIDLLVKGCVDILEVTGKDADGKPVYRSLGKRWTSATIAELFQVDEEMVGDRPSVRETLRAALDAEDLLSHFNAYARATRDLTDEDEKELPGESEPSEEG